MIPVVAVTALVLLGIFSYVPNTTGALIVEAQSAYGGSSHSIASQAAVLGVTRPTPFTLTVSPGSYSVSYLGLAWYYTPSPKSVIVIGGGTAYAVGTYTPILDFISVYSSSFNCSIVKAEHSVTPVVWIDRSTQAVQLSSPSFGAVVAPNQNFTKVFSTPGNFTVELFGSGTTMQVVVA